MPPIPDTWRALLNHAIHHPSWVQLQSFLSAEYAAGKTIYPPREQWFTALALSPPESVRVVILGQDPYHGEGQAHGLSFSVPEGIRMPPSLRNIYKELARSQGCEIPTHGNLSAWARQGVLLLNSVMTVEADQAGSHRKRGWENFTDELVRQLATSRDGLVFMLWGSYAIDKAGLIDASKHLILTSPHPSPLSAHRGFIGNGHFDAANAYLQNQGQSGIVWC